MRVAQDTKVYPPGSVIPVSVGSWKKAARINLQETFKDPVMRRLLAMSNLTTPQFESVLLDQVGTEIAEKPLTREEMAMLRGDRVGISRGAFNRTLKQGRSNISEAIYTVLLLGYSGLLESPGLVPFVEASQRLRGQLNEMKKVAESDEKLYRRLVDELLSELERANEALQGRET